MAIGDSIGYNSPSDCPGCKGFIEQYAAKLGKDTGYGIEVKNITKHNGLQVQGLLDDIAASPDTRQALADAEVIIVGISFNDIEWNIGEDPCDAALPADTRAQAIAAFKMYTPACVKAWAETMRPRFEQVYAGIANARAGKATILLALNRYNDWIGWCESRACPLGPTTPAEVVAGSRLALEAWNKMVCETATKVGFDCVDIYHAFNGANGLAASGDLLGNDYTHPSQLGNDRIAQLLIARGYAPLVP